MKTYGVKSLHGVEEFVSRKEESSEEDNVGYNDKCLLYVTYTPTPPTYIYIIK